MTEKLYTAVGIFKQRRGANGNKYPYVSLGKREFILDMQEMVLWASLNWRILTENEIRTIYDNKVKELDVDCKKSFEACLYHLTQQGLVAEGTGDIGTDALYDLISELYVVPVSENVFMRLLSFVRLTFDKVPFSSTKRILYRDKRSKSEKKVMRIVNQATFSTAEIIKCVETDKLRFTSDEDILDALYADEYTNADNISYIAKSSPARGTVISDVANLYLRQQIIFGRA